MLLATIGLGAVLPAYGQATKPVALVNVAAASDLKFALDELAAQFEQAQNPQAPVKLRLVYGSSGQFTTQILQGAPFEVFLSADEALVFKLADAGKTLDRGSLYALGRIGVMVPQGSTIKPDPQLKDLAAALTDGRLNKLAIANPEHAPYGARAKEALQHAGLWQAAQAKLVLGENISQATQFVASGAAQAGIVALSLAKAPAFARSTQFALIPASAHQPLRQRMVLLPKASPAAKAFYDYLGSAAARQVFSRYGFELPDAGGAGAGGNSGASSSAISGAGAKASTTTPTPAR